MTRWPCLSLALLLAGVGGCTAPDPEPDVLQIAIHAKRPARLSPFPGSGDLAEAISELLYDGGFDMEPGGLKPALFEATYERWGATYYARIAAGARFAEAPSFAERPVEAADVIFTYSALRSRGLGQRPFLESYLRSVRASDRPGWDLAFVFSEDPGKEAFLRLASLKIVPRPPQGVRASAWLERLERWPIGSGPYRLVEFGETLLFEANRPGLRHSKIRLQFSESAGRLEQDFLARRLAVCAGVWPSDAFDIPARLPMLRSQAAFDSWHYALALNTGRPPLDQESLRQALLSLIEPAALVRTLAPDPQLSVSWGPWPQPYLSETLGLRPTSLEALVPAVRAGPSLQAELELIWMDAAADKSLAPVVARRLADQIEGASQGGVRLTRLRGLEPAAFRERLRTRRFDLCLVRLDVADLPDVLQSGDPELNYTGLRDPALEELVLRWPRAEDLDERRAIVRAMTRHLARNAAWCFLFTPVYWVYHDSSKLKLPQGGLLEMMRAVEAW